MDFAAATARVTGFLAASGYRSALIGGVGLAAYGLGRMTLDLDLVTDRDAQGPLVAFMESLGYETVHRSTGYSNHQHADPSWGQVDFVYVAGDTAERLFAASRKVAGPGGTEVTVAAPEHLAAMKLLAIKNDPSRAHQDLADLRFLLHLPGIDREQVRQYFERHGLLDYFAELTSGL